MLDVDKSWRDVVAFAYDGLSPSYIEFLKQDAGYFPTCKNFLNAFKTLPLDKTKYILFGQDPYPRAKSATGYAFIDGAVERLFSQKGFSTQVNKATSLRNFLKMLLLSDGYLKKEDVSQEAISNIDKSDFIDSIDELRINFEQNGVLLLNTALIFTDKKHSKLHVKEFRVFMNRLLESLTCKDIKLIFFGSMAKDIKKHLTCSNDFVSIETLHPYNIGFIYDLKVQDFFRPMKLLYKSIH